MKALFKKAALCIAAIGVMASLAITPASWAQVFMMEADLDTVERELTVVRYFCENIDHRGYWQPIDGLVEVIYFCDGAYKGIWVYAAYPVTLFGSDLTMRSLRASSEWLLVPEDPAGIRYIVDTNRLVFLGIGYEVKRPKHLDHLDRNVEPDVWLQFMVLLPDRILVGLDFGKFGKGK